MCSRFATVGATASSERATGATASEVMMLAMANPVIACASSIGEQHDLSETERARGDDRIDREQPSAVLVGRQIVEPRLGDDVLAGEAQPGDEAQPRPRPVPTR
jgi:hypothetical protein